MAFGMCARPKRSRCWLGFGWPLAALAERRKPGRSRRCAATPPLAPSPLQTTRGGALVDAEGCSAALQSACLPLPPPPPRRPCRRRRLCCRLRRLRPRFFPLLLFSDPASLPADSTSIASECARLSSHPLEHHQTSWHCCCCCYCYYCCCYCCCCQGNAILVVVGIKVRKVGKRVLFLTLSEAVFSCCCCSCCCC